MVWAIVSVSFCYGGIMETAIWLLFGITVAAAIVSYHRRDKGKISPKASDWKPSAIARAERAKPSPEKSEEWRNDPATQKQLDYIESLGGRIPSLGLTKGEASSIIDGLQPADENDLKVIRFFKMPTRGLRHKTAKDLAESLLSNADNRARWGARPPSSEVREFFTFFGEKLPAGINHDDALAMKQSKVKELVKSDPDKIAEWNSYSAILDNLSDPDYREGYDIKKPSASLVKRVMAQLLAEGWTYERMLDEEEEFMERLIEADPSIER